MSYVHWLIFFCFSCGIAPNVESLSTIVSTPDRVASFFYNPKYMKWANMSVVRYGRRGLPTFNFGGANLQTFGNNVSFSVKMYEFLSNTYRPTMMEGGMRLCKFFNLDPLLGQKVLASFNTTCPIPPGEYRLTNYTLPALVNFKYKLPITWDPYSVRIRTDIRLFVTMTNVTIISVQTYANVKQTSS